MTKTSPTLRDLRTQLRSLRGDMADLRREIGAVREAIAAEELRLGAEDAALETQVLAKWDAGMSVPEIAEALAISSRRVLSIQAAWRKGQGTTVRRGRALPDRRRV